MTRWRWGREPGYEHPLRMTGRSSALREINRLKVSLGVAGLRRDRRAAQYLARRLESAERFAAAHELLKIEDHDV
jgi:hypothetical protein